MKHILFTAEEGGDIYISDITDEDTVKLYEDAKETGVLPVVRADMIISVPLKYIVLAETVDNFDFVLNRSRDTKEMK